MNSNHEFVERIDAGEDFVLIYRVGERVSLVVTTQDNGEAEVFLTPSQCDVLIEGVSKAKQAKRGI